MQLFKLWGEKPKIFTIKLFSCVQTLLRMCLQVQQNILLQVKQPAHPQAPATNQFSSQQDVPVDKVVIASSANTGAPAQLPSVLQPTSVLIKTPAPGWTLGWPPSKRAQFWASRMHRSNLRTNVWLFPLQHQVTCRLSQEHKLDQ